jgi:hypothetical protein
LWLSNNQLGGQTPADLPHGLELLKLSDNNLTGTIPASLANTTARYVFSFTDNSIEGTIPSEFAKLSGMQYLDLG